MVHCALRIADTDWVINTDQTHTHTHTHSFINCWLFILLWRKSPVYCTRPAR